MLSFADRVEGPKYVLVCFLEKVTVSSISKPNFYYGLDEIGTRMWQIPTASSSVMQSMAHSSQMAGYPSLLRKLVQAGIRH